MNDVKVAQGVLVSDEDVQEDPENDALVFQEVPEDDALAFQEVPENVRSVKMVHSLVAENALLEEQHFQTEISDFHPLSLLQHLILSNLIPEHPIVSAPYSH